MTANARRGDLACVATAYLVSVAAYSRIPEPYCGPGCTMSLARPLIAFALPSLMAVVVVFLGVLWARDSIRDRDAHLEATYHAVIRTVVLFVLGLHAAVLFALTSQLHPDVIRVVAHAVPVMFGLALIIIGNLTRGARAVAQYFENVSSRLVGKGAEYGIRGDSRHDCNIS